MTQTNKILIERDPGHAGLGHNGGDRRPAGPKPLDGVDVLRGECGLGASGLDPKGLTGGPNWLG